MTTECFPTQVLLHAFPPISPRFGRILLRLLPTPPFLSFIPSPPLLTCRLGAGQMTVRRTDGRTDGRTARRAGGSSPLDVPCPTARGSSAARPPPIGWHRLTPTQNGARAVTLGRAIFAPEDRRLIGWTSHVFGYAVSVAGGSSQGRI